MSRITHLLFEARQLHITQLRAGVTPRCGGGSRGPPGVTDSWCLGPRAALVRLGAAEGGELCPREALQIHLRLGRKDRNIVSNATTVVILQRADFQARCACPQETLE